VKVYFVSINYFSIPLVKQIENTISGDPSVDEIIIFSNVLDQSLLFSNKTFIKPFATFSNYIDCLNHYKGIKGKFKRYKKLWQAVLAFCKDKEAFIFYTIDFQVLPFIILASSLFRKKLFLLYHEFELIENKQSGIFNKILFLLYKKFSYKINLVCVPEMNRIDFMKKVNKISPQKFFLLPNSCNRVDDDKISSSINDIYKDEETMYLGHIGNAGAEHHLEDLLAVCLAIQQQGYKIHLLFVGEPSSETLKVFSCFQNLKYTIINQVPHESLWKYYKIIDVGLILYKPIDLNFKFCAPNKLYEYWSFGVPVIAPMIDGLISVFNYTIGGRLINMSDRSLFNKTIVDFYSDFKNRSIPHEKIRSYFNDHLQIQPYLNELHKEIFERANSF
jgi:hypothetical protein